MTKTQQPTVLAAARVVTGRVVHTPGWVSYHADRIVAVGAGRPERVDQDLGDAIVVPGFVDLHVHGGGGGAFTDGDQSSALRAIHAHRQHGTTTTIASLVTDSPDGLLNSVKHWPSCTTTGTSPASTSKVLGSVPAVVVPTNRHSCATLIPANWTGSSM